MIHRGAQFAIACFVFGERVVVTEVTSYKDLSDPMVKNVLVNP